MPSPYLTWVILRARRKKRPPATALILPYSYGGFKGHRKVGVIRGAFFETERTDKHFCIKHQGFGISFSVLTHLLNLHPRIDYVVIKYRGRSVDKTLMTKLTDFIGGVRDRLSPDDDEQVFLREDQFKTVVVEKRRPRHGKKKRHSQASKEEETDEGREGTEDGQPSPTICEDAEGEEGRAPTEEITIRDEGDREKVKGAEEEEE